MIRPTIHRSLFFLFILLSVVLVRADANAGGPPAGCGDGILQLPELCDDGNVMNGDGCSSTCQFEVLGACCVGAGSCAVGLQGACLAASGTYQGDLTTCEPNPCVSCGDGAVNQPGEQCDDGNIDDGDGCSATCETEFCGDGIANNACQMCAQEAACALAVCGEECDDGNDLDGDGCSTACEAEFCGDGVVQSTCGSLNARGVCLSEECDDGNTDDGDGCSSECENEDTCTEACASPGALHVNAANAVLVGTAGADILCGDERNNVLRGMAGGDILCGFGAADTLYGHLGDDFLDGGEGDDHLRAEDGDDTVVGGPGRDALFGHDGSDDLDGGSGNDTIRGGAGSDTLEGGPDVDVLNGEGGTDLCNGGETTTNCP